MSEYIEEEEFYVVTSGQRDGDRPLFLSEENGLMGETRVGAATKFLTEADADQARAAWLKLPAMSLAEPERVRVFKLTSRHMVWT